MSTLFLLDEIVLALLGRYLCRWHVPRWNHINRSLMLIVDRVKHILSEKAISDLGYFFAILSTVVAVGLSLVRWHHWFTKTSYVFSTSAKSVDIILLILAWAWLHFLWLDPETLWFRLDKTTGYSFLCNAFESVMIVFSWTYLWIIINFPKRISSSYSKCTLLCLRIESQFVLMLILPRIRRIFPRLMEVVN